MANLSQSHILESLGWATLNSFWQMALLWCVYLAVCNLFNLSSHKKYQLSVWSVAIGFAWSVTTFLFYYQSSAVSTIAIFNQTATDGNSLLNVFLLSASVAYLSLLVFPSYKLFRNWQFVQCIKKEGLHKTDYNYRLFVKKLGKQLGISKKVFVYVSEIVKSPVTIGYLKPVILLPLAALNNLSTQQVEAVLLHELSHIKRYDYLVNFIISIISTLLYFNPFVKQFMKNIEAERENCCDELVLQFGYDKVGYAAALLTLEKISLRSQTLALAATGKNFLLNRIEKIVGMEKKKTFKLTQFAGVLAALFCIVAFNSILIIKEEKSNTASFAYTAIANPFTLFSDEAGSQLQPNSVSPPINRFSGKWIASKKQIEKIIPAPTIHTPPLQTIPVAELTDNNFVNASADDADASLSNEQKTEIKSTVAATKKIVSSLQWRTIENEIGDAMNKKEKAMAHLDYLKEIEKINWKHVEQNMKAQYEKLDWNKINNNVSIALADIKLDSLQTKYSSILSELEKTNMGPARAKSNCIPMPDVSVTAIKKAEEELKAKVEIIKALRTKKIVHL